MANIFLAVPQYKTMPDVEVERIKKELNMGEWVTQHSGFHPMFDVSLSALFQTTRHTIGMCKVNGDGNLPRVRSFQLGSWKYEWDVGKKCEYFMIIDEDISFTPDAIDLLIGDDKPIIGGIYTFKTTNPYYTGKVCTRLFDDAPVEADKPFRVRWLNGGFVLIKAEVLLEMIEKYKHLAFSVAENSGGITEAWALWCPFVYEHTFLSEDWAFSQRAREVGFEIWADMRVKLIHWSSERGFAIHL